MVFELFEKSNWMAAGASLGGNQVTVRKSMIRFGENLVKAFNDAVYVEVYFDKMANKIGFRGTNIAQRGYKLSAHKAVDSEGNVRKDSLSGKFLNEIKTGIYEAVIEGDLVIIGSNNGTQDVVDTA